MRFCGVIVAAGSGVRAGQGAKKQWRRLGGHAVVRWSAEALLSAGAAPLVVVVSQGDEDVAADALAGLSGWTLVRGGETRTQSVQAGLDALSDAPDEAAVLIHDAARPFVNAGHVAVLVEALEEADGALPALPVSDTLKREGDGATVPRDGLRRAQTPQAFRLGPLRRAFATWPVQEEPPTDDAMVVERAGGRVALIAGDPVLMKLTYPEDFAMAELIARGLGDQVSVVGQGFDAHRFGPGDSVWLCGVRIPHTHGLVGHSDADAGLHALTDAMLGAVGAGDIGEHFPPSDPKWKGADSTMFLGHALQLVREAGGELINIDVTLICERPKVSPHRPAMRERLAGLLGLPLARVSVKATTTEGMGFTGRAEGLAAQAMVSVRMSVRS